MKKAADLSWNAPDIGDQFPELDTDFTVKMDKHKNDVYRLMSAGLVTKLEIDKILRRLSLRIDLKLRKIEDEEGE